MEGVQQRFKTFPSMEINQQEMAGTSLQAKKIGLGDYS